MRDESPKTGLVVTLPEAGTIVAVSEGRTRGSGGGGGGGIGYPYVKEENVEVVGEGTGAGGTVSKKAGLRRSTEIFSVRLRIRTEKYFSFRLKTRKGPSYFG